MTKELIVVTGGAGFIGSHLIERLIVNYKVISIDNYFTGSKENHIDGAKYIHGSCEEINEILQNEQVPKYLFHLGEYSRVEQSFDDVNFVLNNNKKGIISILEYIKKTGTKLIYSGSSTKFGDGGLGREQSPYAWTKATNTDLIVNYGKWFGIDYAITYFYNVYGGREISYGKYATLIAIFKKKYLNGEKLTIVSPGTQKRNFTHIDDIVDALILIAKRGTGDNFGIGANEAYSIIEIAEMFNTDVEFLPERRGNRFDAEVVSDKTKALGWKQNYKLDKYIQNLIQYEV
jgi:UDP-glucose 4-epimerase